MTMTLFFLMYVWTLLLIWCLDGRIRRLEQADERRRQSASYWAGLSERKTPE